MVSPSGDVLQHGHRQLDLGDGQIQPPARGVLCTLRQALSNLQRLLEGSTRPLPILKRAQHVPQRVQAHRHVRLSRGLIRLSLRKPLTDLQPSLKGPSGFIPPAQSPQYASQFIQAYGNLRLPSGVVGLLLRLSLTDLQPSLKAWRAPSRSPRVLRTLPRRSQLAASVSATQECPHGTPPTADEAQAPARWFDVLP